jgi:hypothetical protein
MTTVYYSELMDCTNLKTGRVTYYIKKCGTFSRVTRAAWDARYFGADGLQSLHSVSTKTHRRSYRTVIVEVRND